MMSATLPNADPGSPAPNGQFLADPVAEGRRVVAGANDEGLTLRLLGGVAVFLRSPDAKPLLGREIHDIDLVAPRDSKRAVERVFQRLGYTSDEMFNAFHGASRQLYIDLVNQRKVDVFVGSFSMCHEIPIADRLDRDPLTVPLAELLLTKLQIVQLNERDERDIYNLCFHNSLSATEQDGIEADFIGALCAGDWGLWRTCRGTIERCRADLRNYELSPVDRRLIDTRLQELWERIDAAPKSGRWKRRSRVGDRMRWYQEPEEE